MELTVGAGPGAPRVRLGVVNRLGMTEGRLQWAQTVQEQCSFRATTLAVDAKEAPLEPMSPRKKKRKLNASDAIVRECLS